MNGLRAVCFQCEEREIGCHGACKKYIEAKEEYIKECENIKKQKKANSDFIGFNVENRRRTKRRHGVKV